MTEPSLRQTENSESGPRNRAKHELQQTEVLPDHVGVELLVPAAVQRSGHIEPPAVQTQLQHLRSSTDSLSLKDINSVWSEWI